MIAEDDDDVPHARADDRGEEDREGQRRQGEPGVGKAHDDLVDPAAEIARDDAERRSDNAGENYRGKADYHRHPGAEDQPRQHVAAELVGAEQVFGSAARLPERRFEARRQAADLGIVGRQHIGENRHQGDRAEDQAGTSGKSPRRMQAQRGEARCQRKADDIGWRVMVMSVSSPVGYAGSITA